MLRRLTGAEAALVVNNNAAAVLLALAALAEGREVLVSRGELIEIGDGFRIPDVLARSGARLVEVGTTNRTRAADYERAVGARDGGCSCACTSRTSASSASPSSRASRSSRAVARARTGSPLVDDLGSGALADARGRAAAARDSLAAGADLVCFSGDKLLGGPQAGIVVGRAELVERLRRHPLQRALRADKLTLAALEGTLALYLDAARARSRCCGCCASPPRRSARAPSGSRRSVGGEVEETVARVGGGALPLAELAELGVRGRGGARARRSARGDPPVVASSATAGRCSTAARSRDAEADEVAARRRRCACR